MQKPADAFETEAASVWVVDDLVHIQAKGVASTTDTMAETFAAVRDLTDGKPLPALFDARDYPPAGSEIWSFFIANAASAFTAAAVVVEANARSEMASFPDAINRLLIPFQVFTDEAEARAFLDRLPS